MTNSIYQTTRLNDASARTTVPPPRFADDADPEHTLDPFLDPRCMTDDEEFAEDYGLSPTMPIAPFTEDDLRFLRDFILGTALYVEQLESLICDPSDDFWEAREHAYRIITALLIRHYEYELEG
jgi:hypothetical protein